MKKISPLLTLLPCLFTLILLSSCLGEDSKGQLTEEQTFTSAQSIYVNAVSSLYSYIGGTSDSEGLQGTYRGVYDFNTFTTDEAMIPTRGGDWYDGGFWQNLYLHTWTPSDASLNNTWNYLFKVVMLSNQSLDIIRNYSDLLTASQQYTFSCEVRAVRALFYFYLLDLFGRVPIVTDANQQVGNVKQSNRSQVFNFVVSELQEVTPYLSPDHSNLIGNHYGRITQPVAYFLLAKLMLNAEVYSHDDWTSTPKPDGADLMFNVFGKRMNAWEACVAYCQELDVLGYELENNYANNFAVQNEGSKENIFTIPMDKTLYPNIFKNLFRSRHYQHGSALGFDAENGSCATVSTCLTFGYGTDDVDTRWHSNFYADKIYVDGQPVMLEDGTQLEYQPLDAQLVLTGTPHEKTAGARMSKYEIDRKAYSDGLLQNNDIVLFRYADVLLMQAEAEIRNGNSGQNELDQIRQRAHMSPINATLDNILDERLRELVWEGWRRNDLIRFQMFHKAYEQRPQLPGEQNAYTSVFPIPTGAMSLNKNLTQNPGY